MLQNEGFLHCKGLCMSHLIISPRTQFLYPILFSMEIHWYKTCRHVAVQLPVNTGHFYICGEQQTTSEHLPIYGIIMTATIQPVNPVFTFLPVRLNIFCLYRVVSPQRLLGIDILITFFLFENSHSHM